MKKTLVPEYIRNLKIYQSGKPIDEVTREKGLEKISKLASNENPLWPSPFAIREMTQGLWDLHRYPDQHAHHLKTTLSELYGLKKKILFLEMVVKESWAILREHFFDLEMKFSLLRIHLLVSIFLARSSGANLVTVPLTESYKYDVDAIIKKLILKPK